MVKVVIVEDSTLMAKVLQMLVERAGGQVVGCANSADCAMDLIRLAKPDVVTLDLTLPGGGSLELLSDIVSTLAVPVVVVSGATYEGSPAVSEALRRGAETCIDKASLCQHGEFIEALTAAALNRPIDATPHGMACAR